MGQISFFDGQERLKINKPIRLIELFAGYGSQSLALKYLGIHFEHHRICEWAVKSIQAYKDLHFGDDNTDYSSGIPKEDVEKFLFERGISADYNQPMTMEQIHRMGEQKQRRVYNNIKATRNLVSVCNCHADDLAVTDTDKYTYIMTYSFPCQDLSSAGMMKGMGKDSGTRSGLLWEVERLLLEMKELPQILLMENVPEVIGRKNIKHFAEWLKRLESLGYHCYWKCLNAKDYGVPQSRNRCFMVSILGDAFYEFPEKVNLTKALKDVLQDTVEEKYFLSDKFKKGMVAHNEKNKQKGGGLFRITPIDGCAAAITTRQCRSESNYIIVSGHVNGMREQNGRVYDTNGLSPTLQTCSGGNLQPFIDVNDKIRKLTPLECFRLMGVKDDDFEVIAKNQSDSSLFHLAGDSIVVDVLMAIFKQML